MTPTSTICEGLQQAIAHVRRERDKSWEAGDLAQFNDYQEEIQDLQKELKEAHTL